MNNHLSDIESGLEHFTADIIKTPHTNDKQILSSVYNKIVSYIIINSGLGSPDQSNVVKETRAALSSVFHVFSVKPFLNKSANEKREQLKQLTNIVTGIRLFYWHYGDYGDDIDNIPDALMKGISKSLHDVEKRKNELNYYVKKYTEALFHHYKFDMDEYFMYLNKDCYDVGHPLLHDFKSRELNDVKFVKTTINLLHQYLKFLDDIYYVFKYAQDEVNKTNDEFHEALIDLQKFTKYKNKYIVTEYVPTDMVVEKFTNVASHWTLWKYLVSVHIMNDLEETLYQTFKETKLPSSDLIDHFSKANQDEGDKEESKFEVDEKELTNTSCKLVEFSPNVPLKFLGFSALFVILEGFLVPSDLSTILEYKNEYYSFSSREAMMIFCKSADRLITKMSKTLHQYPELMEFFQIKDTFVQEETIMCETGIQTELHPIKHFIDKNYHFNAYEVMRRHRKQRHNYLNSKHKSTKTCVVEDVSTQTYEQRTVSTQESDKGTSMPRPLRYVYGLRGYNNDSIIQDEDYVPLLNIQLK